MRVSCSWVLLVCVAAVRVSAGEHAVILTETDEHPEPPLPYAAGRAPGHVDRVHSETSDGSGVVKGQYSYVDPRHKVRTVDYVADAYGFRAVLSDPVRDTPTVAAAKQHHQQLYEKIAADHARIAAERAPHGDLILH